MAMSDKKNRAINRLLGRWVDCKRCQLGELREKKHKQENGRAGNIVFGDGDGHADLVIIGIGPGETEDAMGYPFCGASGEIVNKHLSRAKLERSKTFMMNIVSCRPFSAIKDPKTGRVREENRDPSLTEREQCRPLWQELLYLVDPLLVVAMGKPAVQEVTGKRSVTMRDIQGKIKECIVPGRVTDVRYPVMCMYHPAFLSRTGDTFKGGPWHQALITWRRTAHYLDQLRYHYRGIAIPDRGFKEKDLFLIEGGLPV